MIIGPPGAGIASWRTVDRLRPRRRRSRTCGIPSWITVCSIIPSHDGSRSRERPTGCARAPQPARHLNIRRFYRLIGSFILGISNDSSCRRKAADAETETYQTSPAAQPIRPFPPAYVPYRPSPICVILAHRLDPSQGRSAPPDAIEKTSERQRWPAQRGPEHPGIPRAGTPAHSLPVPGSLSSC